MIILETYQVNLTLTCFSNVNEYIKKTDIDIEESNDFN